MQSLDSSEQKKLTLQKVSKLMGDKTRQKQPVTLKQRETEAITGLLNPDGKLSNFWLDLIVARPALLASRTETLLR